jgi:hypothetical protein
MSAAALPRERVHGRTRVIGKDPAIVSAAGRRAQI